MDKLLLKFIRHCKGPRSTRTEVVDPHSQAIAVKMVLAKDSHVSSVPQPRGQRQVLIFTVKWLTTVSRNPVRERTALSVV